MDGEMGLAAALRAMTADDRRSCEEWAMFSALPDAPVQEVHNHRARVLDRIERLVRPVGTGRAEVSAAGRRTRPKPGAVSRTRPA